MTRNLYEESHSQWSHLRILRKRLEKLMGKSVWKDDPPWSDLPKQQWVLLWLGETMWEKYVALMWEAGHKMVTLFQGASTIPLHTILCVTGEGIQTHHDQGPSVKRVPVSERNIIQAYLNLVDWRHIQEGTLRGTSKTHLRTIQSYIAPRIGGSQGTPQRGNSGIVVPENSRGRTVGGGTVPTRTHSFTPRVWSS